MKEHPILFSAPMVRAILAGRKTQTRRIVKIEPWIAGLGGDLSRAWADKAFGVTPCLKVPCLDETVQRLRNPWGWPEPNRPWVRESWSTRLDRDHVKPSDLDPTRDSIMYWADPQTCNAGSGGAAGKKRPSIFLPRWASRITLEVTEVRVQRLRDITEDDARAEGVEPFFDRFPSIGRDQRLTSGELAADSQYRASYAVLWDEINADRATWKSNPWVWAVSFKVVPTVSR